MNQYITLLFSFLADFFATQNPTPPARETGPRVRLRAPEPGAREEQGHACQDDQVFLIVPLTGLSRLARLEQMTVVRDRLIPNGAWRGESLPGP